MRKLDHCNIVRLRYFFYSSGEKVRMKNGKVLPSTHLGRNELLEFLETRKSVKIVITLRRSCSDAEQVFGTDLRCGSVVVHG